MKTTEQFLPYQSSLMLKELGFDEPCLSLHDEGLEYEGFGEVTSRKVILLVNPTKNSQSLKEFITAPTWMQVEQWLWENHELFIEVYAEGEKFGCKIYTTKEILPLGMFHKDFDSPITAHQAGIIESIQYLKSKKP